MEQKAQVQVLMNGNYNYNYELPQSTKALCRSKLCTFVHCAEMILLRISTNYKLQTKQWSAGLKRTSFYVHGRRRMRNAQTILNIELK